MRGKTIAKILLSLVVVVAAHAASATVHPVADYITSSHSRSQLDSQLAAIRDVIEEHGSIEPEKTAELIGELELATEQMRSGFLSREADKFKLLEVITDGEYLEKFRSALERLRLVSGQQQDRSCSREALAIYLDAILLVFGGNLNALIDGKPTHDAKLRTFLLCFGKQLAQFCLAKTYESHPNSLLGAETQMDMLVMLDGQLKPGDREEELLDKASDLDLVRGQFDSLKMLQTVETSYLAHKATNEEVLKAHERLLLRLLVICHKLDDKYGRMFAFYNLARLLAPEVVSRLSPTVRFQKLNEYSRVCLPTDDPEKLEAIQDNIRRNMPSFISSIKRILSKKKT